MNLRQKVKQAKKELQLLEELPKSASTYEVWVRFQKKAELTQLIDRKRKPDRYAGWKDEVPIDWGELTYISLRANFKEFGVLTMPNSRVIKVSTAQAFVDDLFKNEMIPYAQRVANLPADKERFVDYSLAASTDRKKGKLLQVISLYRQYHGDDRLLHLNERLIPKD